MTAVSLDHGWRLTLFDKGTDNSKTTKLRSATTATENRLTRVVGYGRVSTEGQAQEGGSLDAQRAKLTAYAMAMDLELVKIIVDEGRSAKTLERQGLQTALSTLAQGKADALLVTKLDRLTRSVKDLGFFPPFGFRYAAQLDAQGRRLLE